MTDGSATTSYTDPEGTIYVVTGGAGGALHPQSGSAGRTRSAFFLMTHHVCSIDVDGGHLSLQAIGLDGAAFHTFGIEKSPGGSLRFVRGDANGDGRDDLSDPIQVLGFLFAGKPLRCLDAADANDDGALNMADAIFVLQYLFDSGPPIPPPYPNCGTDPTVDDLECREFPTCE